jgi:CheY-like chemotaxis protein
MTQLPDLPSLPPTQASSDVEAWSTATVRCVLVPRGQQVDVELRNVDGVPFLRKTAADPQSANNEAAVLRLYVGDERRPRAWRGLKPFVIVAHNGSHQAFASALRAMGLRVLAVGSGREATSAARDLVPDLIVLDDALSDGNGVDVCGQLRNAAETADIPIVIVTASPDAIHPRDPQGPDAVLAEPCGFDTIMATARLLLRDLIATEPAATAL